MNKKITSISIFFTFLFSLVFWYSLVFAWSNDSIFFKESDYIFPDTVGLNKVRYIIKSKSDFSNPTINSTCDLKSSLISSNKNFYVMDIFLLDNNCDDKDLNFTINSWESSLSSNLKIYDNTILYSQFLDKSDNYISKISLALEKKLISLKNYSNSEQDLFLKLKNDRKISETVNMIEVANDIIFKRSKAYSIPILWSVLPTNPNKVPNTLRPYRSSYTDGIHHGWDIDWNLWENITSIDDWVIIRVVNWFKYSDLDNIVYGENLSLEQKTLNLDVLRWNQVWLKTMKWDVVFYSHLNDIYSNIKEGYFIEKGEPIGTIWATWVPDKDYDDFHVHFPIHKNPYDDNKKTDYTFFEIMNWDWYFKWETPSYIIENQYNVFEK